MELYSDSTLEEMRNERKNMKPKQDDKFFDEYTQKRKNGCFYSELGSESLLITKIWDFNKTILDKWADVNLLISINEIKTNRKMKKGLKSIANNLSGEGYSKEVTGDILEKLGKTRLARTEEFSVQEFINLIDELKKEKTSEETE